MVLQPWSPGQNIAIGGSGDVGTNIYLNLTAKELGSLQNGFAGITIGRSNSPNAFEVGANVREQFIVKDANAELAFKKQSVTKAPDKYLADIYLIATQRLKNLGISQIYGAGQTFGSGQSEDWCTFTDEKRFFSFRRDGATGRMATLIWLA